MVRNHQVRNMNRPRGQPPPGTVDFLDYVRRRMGLTVEMIYNRYRISPQTTLRELTAALDAKRDKKWYATHLRHYEIKPVGITQGSSIDLYLGPISGATLQEPSSDSPTVPAVPVYRGRGGTRREVSTHLYHYPLEVVGFIDDEENADVEVALLLHEAPLPAEKDKNGPPKAPESGSDGRVNGPFPRPDTPVPPPTKKPRLTGSGSIEIILGPKLSGKVKALYAEAKLSKEKGQRVIIMAPDLGPLELLAHPDRPQHHSHQARMPLLYCERLPIGGRFRCRLHRRRELLARSRASCPWFGTPGEAYRRVLLERSDT